jgi:hypothetical protein
MASDRIARKQWAALLKADRSKNGDIHTIEKTGLWPEAEENKRPNRETSYPRASSSSALGKFA